MSAISCRIELVDEITPALERLKHRLDAVIEAAKREAEKELEEARSKVIEAMGAKA